MIAAVDRFVLSRSPYAIKVETFDVVDRTFVFEGVTHPYFRYTVTALWVRRTRGVLGVHIGELSEFLDAPGLTLEQFYEQFASSSRYGGDVKARWDGTTLWTAAPVPRTEEDELLTVVEPAFEHLVPLIDAKDPVTVPDGWAGWYQLTHRKGS